MDSLLKSNLLLKVSICVSLSPIYHSFILPFRYYFCGTLCSGMTYTLFLGICMKFHQSQGWRGVQPTNVRSSRTTPTVTIWSTFVFSRLVGITFLLKGLFVSKTLFISTTLIQNSYQNKFILLNVFALN